VTTDPEILWGLDMQREAHKMGWDIFINDDGKFYLQALDDPNGVIAEQAEADGLDPDSIKYSGLNFFDRSKGQYADDNAIRFVIEQAKHGNVVCQRAIDFLIDRKSPNVRFFRLKQEKNW
jgi:hypothetical protein